MKVVKHILPAIVALLMIACQPQPDEQKLFDELLVSTNYDPEANFGSYATYAIPTDTVGWISNTGNPNDTILVASESKYPRPVIQALQSALNTRGYSKVARNENPDLGVNIVVVENLNVFQQVVYPDPYYYPGSYYQNYYGYNSWYYYPYVATYSYRRAVLVIELVDLKNRTPDNKVKVVWTAYLGDLYSTINLVGQTEAGIEQAFVQSPFIQKGL